MQYTGNRYSSLKIMEPKEYLFPEGYRKGMGSFTHRDQRRSARACIELSAVLCDT